MSNEREKMTKIEFFKLIREAGFKNKKEFANAVNIPYSSVNAWGSRADFPCYSKALMLALVDVRKYNDLINGNNVIMENISLKKENSDLQIKIDILKNKLASLEVEVEKFKTLKKSLGLLRGYENNAV